MIRLAVADRPDVLCLQEVPLWALPRLERWSGMTARSRRDAAGGPVGSAGRADHAAAQRLLPLGARGTGERDPARGGLEPLEHRSLRIDAGRGEQRHCHAVRLDGLVVANLHATNDFSPPGRRGRGDRPGGGLRLRARRAPARRPRRRLQPPRGAPARAGGLVGARARESTTCSCAASAASPLLVWPRERRLQNGVVLSDHAPVEARIG